jgi:hypothetical protein
VLLTHQEANWNAMPLTPTPDWAGPSTQLTSWLTLTLSARVVRPDALAVTDRPCGKGATLYLYFTQISRIL